MSKKKKTIFCCQSCGAQRPRWEGRCPECGAWNSFVEETVMSVPAQSEARQSWTTQTGVASLDEELATLDVDRATTGLVEFDRVLGGGLVKGSFVLLGGPPGIGKSTLLLQMAGGVAANGKKILYVSGEESIQQTSSRAHRLGVKSPLISVASEANLEVIRGHIEKMDPDVVVIDSIQTVFLPELEAAPGSVSQVRESAGRLLQMAKTQNRSIVLVGHVTKDGAIAGPKVLEHMVDAVLSFEGDDPMAARLLRSVKNRFGPAQELGIFQMSAEGLKEVLNPSELFLQERAGEQMGSAVFASIEGSRPLLCEIQALTVESYQAMPRRTALGVDINRLHLISAVLDRYLDMQLARHDIFLNVVGGLKLTDPGSDLAAAAALMSIFYSRELPRKALFLGEIGLTGEVRSTPQIELRLKEAAKLGFAIFYVPKHQLDGARETLGAQAQVHGLGNVDDLKKQIIIKKERGEKRNDEQQPQQRSRTDSVATR